MPTNHDLLATILDQTLACQDPNTPESKGRTASRYAPFGPHVPGTGGSYPTTDAAMEALAEIADRVRMNDPELKHAVGRDQMRTLASQAVGELLNELAREPDRSKHWRLVRTRLIEKARATLQDITHYVPVWLFLGQECRPFRIGPVRLLERSDWLDVVAERREKESAWVPSVRALWAGKRVGGGSWRAGLKGAIKQIYREPLKPAAWLQAFTAAVRYSEPREVRNGRTIARLIHPDQWIACAEVEGFEQEESRRRGLLAARVALDTIRLVLDERHRRLVSTAADSIEPLSVDRLSQTARKDLAHGWRFNRPGVSGSPGFAQSMVDHAKALFDAAGECIAAATRATPVHPCAALSERWFNAVHWYGRACLADVDFVAVVMQVIALDVLCGGLQEAGILELTARLTGVAMSAQVLSDGTTLRQLVGRVYKLRSEVAHGSVLAVHEALDIERAHLGDLASAALAEYAVQLAVYAGGGGRDDRDEFRDSLPPAKP